MDFPDAEALKQYLIANDAQFAELAREHSQYEKRLSELAALTYPSAEEQIEEAILKKKKLYVKDQMEAIMRRYRQQAVGK
jgi:uncharacterized protein YdcH (DUF465 family)